MNKPKVFLMGYIWGWLDEAYNPPEFYHEIMVENPNSLYGFKHPEPKVYKAQVSAMSDARKYKAENPTAKVFVNGWRYSTDNPKNSKGMLPWEDSMGVKIFVD